MRDRQRTKAHAARGRVAARLGAALAVVLLLTIADARASEPMAPALTPGQRHARILSNLTVHYSSLIWPAGVPITGCFFAEQPELRKPFVDAARRWEEIGNIRFDFGDAPGFRTCNPANASDIRVRYTGTLMGIAAGNSALGTTGLGRRADQPTLNIAARSPYSGEARRQDQLASTMLHEIGHALGLPHEHQHPASVCLSEHLLAAICKVTATRPGVDIEKAADLQRKRADLYRMLPRRFDPVIAWDHAYDPHSIMHYQFLPQHLKGGRQSPCFSPQQQRQISIGDRARIAMLYPRDPAAQRAFLTRQIEVFRQTVKAMGLSHPTAERLALLFAANLHRRHARDGLEVTVAGLDLTSADTTDLEEAFAQPVPPPLPDECRASRQPAPVAPGPGLPTPKWQLKPEHSR